MAHDLATTNGRTAMFFCGETPWHRLGTKLDNPATAAEAIDAARLNYRADLTEMVTRDGIPIPNRKAVIRGDTRSVLGVVGNNYVPIQNAECFSFLDAVVADGSIRYHTAGALGKGERIWMLARLPGHIRVKGSDDITEKFLLLHNSHDGSSALRVFFTPIRVVCANTLSVAERSGRGHGLTVRHQGDLSTKIRQAQTVLGLAEMFYDDMQFKVNLLADHHPTQSQLKNFFEALYPDMPEGENKRAAKIRSELFRLFEDGMGQDIPGIRHSSWAALHAVTEWVDHHRPTRVRAGQDRDSLRLQSQWFGSGAALKARGWQLALQMATAG